MQCAGNQGTDSGFPHPKKPVGLIYHSRFMLLAKAFLFTELSVTTECKHKAANITSVCSSLAPFGLKLDSEHSSQL